MCFMLYAGTAKPIPRNKWKEGSLSLPVESITEHDAPISAHFGNPEVQYIGSTSGCGCDFPHLMLQNGGWPFLKDPRRDAERDASDRHNMEALVALLGTTGEETVELYGFWAGDATAEPRAREQVSLDDLLDADFHFKERGFYRVSLESSAGCGSVPTQE